MHVDPTLLSPVSACLGALVGGSVAFVLPQPERIGGCQIDGCRGDDFLDGMARLIEAAGLLLVFGCNLGEPRVDGADTVLPVMGAVGRQVGCSAASGYGTTAPYPSTTGVTVFAFGCASAFGCESFSGTVSCLASRA